MSMKHLFVAHLINKGNNELSVMLSWEHHLKPWHPSQSPGLGVVLVWTPNPIIAGPDLSHSVFKWASKGGTRVPGFCMCSLVFCLPCHSLSHPPERAAFIKTLAF